MVGADRRPLLRLAKPAATVEPMRLLNKSHVHTGYVVRRRCLSARGRSGCHGVPRRAAILPLILVCLLAVAFPVVGFSEVAWADDASSASPSASASASQSADADSSSGATLSTDITDPNNLLGENVTAVTDAIANTKKEYGVSVRLLYLDTFNTSDKPDTWASRLLQSTDPSPNTVMLAVASQDGSLVVAVSSNSDAWLKSQSTVDELSAAAQEPLVKKKTPDWSGSAIAMMNRIGDIKETSTSRGTKVASTAIYAGVAALMVVLIAVTVILARNARGAHSRGGRQHRSRRARARRTARTGRDNTQTPGYRQYADDGQTAGSSDSEPQGDDASAGQVTQTIDVSAYLERFAQQDTGHSQETRRHKRNAGHHEQTN